MGRPRGQTRDRVVEAALESLKRNGYGASTSRAIARIGGFNPALIFYYFESVDDLLVAALASSSEERLERYREAVESSAGISGLLDVMRTIYAEDVESGHIRVVSEMVGASVANEELASRVVELMQPWLQLAERGVAEALEGTPFEPLVPARAAALAGVTFYLGANLLTHLQDDDHVTMLLELAARYASFLDAPAPRHNRCMEAPDRHVRLLTETIAAVNSTLDLEEVLSLVARKVAEALRTEACFVYLFDEGAEELVLRATHGTAVEAMTRRPRMRPGEGITGTAAAQRTPIAISAAAHLDPRFKGFPNLPEDQYESILAVPILAREKLAGALNVRTVEPREFTADEIELLLAIAAQVAQTIEHAKLYSEAQRRVGELEALARISEAVSESLYLEESLEAIVKTTVDAVGASGAALVLEDGNIAWPEGQPGAHAVRIPLRWKGRQIGELVCDRDTAFTDQERALLASIANHAAVALEHGRAVMRGVLAQEIHHRVKNNLQTVASLLRLQARSSDRIDPRKALDDSANRILAIAAVHEVLTESRHDDVELDELLDRLRSMLVQGLGSGKNVETRLDPVSLAGHQATALALVFSELLQNALEHGGDRISIELARRDDSLVLAIVDDGRGIQAEPSGTGLSIVEALVRDELRGTLALSSNGGLRAEVIFPA